jgi:hypothetical protein
MMLIDPEGLFNGDRFRLVSDEARLYWPYLWCASNSYGRLELNYQKVRAEVFGHFHNPPTEVQFLGWVREYHQAFLLFVYEVNGQLWGQWECPQFSLPRYKSAKDRRSPSPDGGNLRKWLTSYEELKKRELEAKLSVLNDCENLRKVSQTCEKFRPGVGVGVGVGLNTSANAPAFAEPQSPSPAAEQTNIAPEPEQFELAPAPAKKSKHDHQQQDAWFEKEFWPDFWRKRDKHEAKMAFRKHAKNAGLKDRIVAAMIRDRPEMIARDPDSRPYAATWLNKFRYMEEAEEQPKVIAQRSTHEPYIPYWKPPTQ